LAADPQKNLIFAYHEYGYSTHIFAVISNIVGNVITLNSTAPTHPLAWPPGWVSPNSPLTGGFTNRGVYINGVQGTMGASLNGQNVKISSVGSSSGAWTATLTVTPSGTYGGGGTMMDWGHTQEISSRLAGYRAQGIRISVLEFGGESSINTNGGATSRGERICGYEAYGLDWNAWQFDGGDGLQMTKFNVGTAYTGIPSQLNYTGVDVIWNPRYGLHALALPAPVFL